MAAVNPTSTPHPTPPLTEEELSDWLRLLRSRRVGIHTFFRLMADHGSAGAALEALPGIAREAGVENYAPCPPEVVAAELRGARQSGVTWLAHGRPGYPGDLAQLADPPPLLALMGDAALLRRPMIAIVGARNASSLGTRMARRMAEELGQEGYVVVSGLARGIDTAAHHASIGTGTIAVMAGGVDVVYPVENAVLAQEIGEKGLRLSEQPMHLEPQARHFPRRNRIISGLAQAVVVVEAAAKSGSLITARAALDQGREVLAVPGHPFDARAGGCNMLIRDGAVLVRSAADVIEALKRETDATPRAIERPVVVPPSAPERRSLAETSALHGRILDRLGPSPVAEDQLIRDLALPAGQVAPELVSLELEGRIRRQPGGLLSLVV
jgi:DNA processing protein